MGKVIVTQEQAEWLDRYPLTQERIDYAIDIQPFGKRPDSPIIDWKPSKVARALYEGYEVGPEFKAKEWVTNKVTGIVNQVNMLRDGDIIQTHDMNYVLDVWYLNNTRHATPEEIATEKQRRWWAKHDRDVYEVKEHDLLDINDVYLSVVEIYESDVILSEGPSVTDQELIFLFNNGNAIVVCFAENRKDI